MFRKAKGLPAPTPVGLAYRGFSFLEHRMRIVAKFSAGIQARRATGDLRPGFGGSNGCTRTASGSWSIRPQESD
jgi:hypothetical protein